MEPLYQRIASTLQAMVNCEASGNLKWHAKHRETLTQLIREHMPSGGGFDRGTRLDEKSTPEKLVFVTAFHHMNDNGYYDGWTDHVVTVTPSLAHGISLRISGKNRNDIKQYIHESFDSALTSE